MRYRKKPVVIEATQWFKPGDHPEVKTVNRYDRKKISPGIVYVGKSSYIETLEGVMNVSEGDWIITGVNGEHYPCKPDIFEKTYEAVTTC